MLNVGLCPPSRPESGTTPSIGFSSTMWDASHCMENSETPLQRFVRVAIDASPVKRDAYDKRIQKLSGTTGKPFYDLQRKRGVNPRTPMLKFMAESLQQPYELLRRAADGEEVDPLPYDSSHQTLSTQESTQTLESIAAEQGWALIEEIDLALGMGATFLDPDRAPERLGIIPFKLDWLRDIYHGPITRLKVVRGRGDSMEPTIRDGDFVLIDTSRTRLDEQDVVWAVSYGDLGMIRRLRQLPGGGVQLMPDNAVVRTTEAYDGELHIMGRVIWIGRRM